MRGSLRWFGCRSQQSETQAAPRLGDALDTVHTIRPAHSRSRIVLGAVRPCFHGVATMSRASRPGRLSGYLPGCCYAFAGGLFIFLLTPEPSDVFACKSWPVTLLSREERDVTRASALGLMLFVPLQSRRANGTSPASRPYLRAPETHSGTERPRGECWYGPSPTGCRMFQSNPTPILFVPVLYFSPALLSLFYSLSDAKWIPPFCQAKG